MLNMLVVDDERIDREGILFLTKNKGLPIECTAVHSAAVALENLQKENFDILFTDIKMPGMDGLALIEQALNIAPQLEIVVYSAFADFEYARRAMSMGVKNYLLKPINPDEFLKAMNDVMERCTESTRETHKKILFDLIYSDAVDLVDGIEWKFGRSLMSLSFSAPFAADVVISQSELESIFPDSLLLSLNEYTALLFSSAKGEELRAKASKLLEFLQKNHDTMAVAVVDGEFSSGQELKDNIEMMRAMGRHSFFYQKSAVVEAESFSQEVSEVIALLSEEIEYLFNRKEFETSKQKMETLFAEIEKNKSTSILYVKHICMRIMESCIKTAEQSEKEEAQRVMQSIIACDSADKLRELCVGFFDKVEEDDGTQLAASKKVVREVLSIIHKEYKDDISMDEIARRVYLSPNYLSYLFKRETGTAFMKYLTNIRLEKAKELLQTTSIKIGAVCEMVGYTNISYFCMVFKNHFHMSPLEYRESKC